MPYLILVTILLCLLSLIPRAAHASGTEIKGKVVTQNETENDYMNRLYEGFIDINLHFPDEMNEDTGLLTLNHGWGGNYHGYDSDAEDWRNKFNVICLQTQYRQSGQRGIDWEEPYDLGKYQAIDVLRAIQYVRENYPVNDERIISCGGSGGGNIALQAAKMAPNTFALVVEWAGITRPTNREDVLGRYKDDIRAEFDRGGMEAAALKAGDHYTLPEWQIRSAQYHAAYFNAPIHIIHGDKDETVNFQHAVDMYDALIAAGKEAYLHTIVNGNHSFAGGDPSEDNRKKATEKYVYNDILTRRSDGKTDFERESRIKLPTDGDCVYVIDYKGGLATIYTEKP